jgi:hypothetical protein
MNHAWVGGRGAGAELGGAALAAHLARDVREGGAGALRHHEPHEGAQRVALRSGQRRAGCARIAREQARRAPAAVGDRRGDERHRQRAREDLVLGASETKAVLQDTAKSRLNGTAPAAPPSKFLKRRPPASIVGGQATVSRTESPSRSSAAVEITLKVEPGAYVPSSAPRTTTRRSGWRPPGRCPWRARPPPAPPRPSARAVPPRRRPAPAGRAWS